MEREQCTPTHAQTIRMRRLFQENQLTQEELEEIMLEEKPNQKRRISFSVERLGRWMPDDLPESKWEEYLHAAVLFYQKNRT